MDLLTSCPLLPTASTIFPSPFQHMCRVPDSCCQHQGSSYCAPGVLALPLVGQTLAMAQGISSSPHVPLALLAMEHFFFQATTAPIQSRVSVNCVDMKPTIVFCYFRTSIQQ
jgi:hypothetical protein